MVAVLALAAVAVGGAITSAQEGDGPVGTFLAKVAEKLGVSEDELKDAVDEARVETIDEAVAEGRLTEEQAERLKERADDGRCRSIFMITKNNWPLSGVKRHVGPDFYLIEAARQVLDITRDELGQQLRDGNSLAEVADGRSIGDREMSTLVTPVSVILAFGVSAMVGLFFGIYPAFSASRLNPIEALRHE